MMIHRNLHLTSPHMHGDDVGDLQRDLDFWRRRFVLTGSAIDEDFGPDTHRLASQVLFMLGANKAQYEDGVTIHEQGLLNDRKDYPALPAGISAAARARSNARRKAHTKKMKAAGHGPNALVAEYAKYEGIVEHPPNSNTGPHIADWERECGMGPGPWCGAAFIHAARKAGYIVPNTWRYVPAAVADARAGRYGYVVPRSSADRGCAICFDWNGDGEYDHIAGVDTAKAIWTWEGNTTKGTAGDQSNGGGLWHRHDHFEAAHAVVCIKLTKRS